MNPEGVQFAMPIFPPGRHTLIISRAQVAWSGANITPKVETTLSNTERGTGERGLPEQQPWEGMDTRAESLTVDPE